MGRRPVAVKAFRGTMLKELLEEKGISQKELSNMIHLSQQTISKIINGKANLTEDNVKRIAECYPEIPYLYERLMGSEPKSFDSPLEFEMAWIRGGGGAHPLNNINAVEARICVALEKMNKKGWKLTVKLVETLSEMPELSNRKEEDQNENS